MIDAVLDAWRNRRSEIEDNASQIAAALDARPDGASDFVAGAETVVNAARLLMRNADAAHGGFGGAPKFPTPTNLELLARSPRLPARPPKRPGVARFLNLTANEMSRRGLFDQLGGGFHRYCTDASWTIPHFEKMLYDQGQLLRFYAEMAQAKSRRRRFRLARCARRSSTCGAR